MELMTYSHNTTDPRGHQFCRDDLSNLTPSDLIRLTNKKVYGVDKPLVGARPVVRAEIIGFWKKVILYFMSLDYWNRMK